MQHISKNNNKNMKNPTFTEVYQKAKFAIGFSLLIIGLYLAITDNSIVNNGILGAGILLAASQTKN